MSEYVGIFLKREYKLRNSLEVGCRINSVYMVVDIVIDMK